MNETSSPPSLTTLREAALRYLARYASPREGVRRVLMRRIDKWLAQQPREAAEQASDFHALVDQVIAELVHAGAIDDTTFAEARARSLRRDGQSGRFARAKLIAKGVPSEIAQSAVIDDPDLELAAILIAARRRRIGPFASPRPDDNPSVPAKELARLARAGFSAELARRALAMPLEEAERRIYDARR